MSLRSHQFELGGCRFARRVRQKRLEPKHSDINEDGGNSLYDGSGAGPDEDSGSDGARRSRTAGSCRSRSPSATSRRSPMRQPCFTQTFSPNSGVVQVLDSQDQNANHVADGTTVPGEPMGRSCAPTSKATSSGVLATRADDDGKAGVELPVR